MSNFYQLYSQYNWDRVRSGFDDKTTADVERALGKNQINLEDFKALISPAAAPYLEHIAVKSHQITTKRFGKTIQMFAPMYLSNECNNICTYCGFSFDNKVKRRTLTDQEIIQEAKALKAMGYDNVLLVTGEANHTVNLPYFKKAVSLLNPYFSNISIEVQPLDQEQYAELFELGVHGVLVYQETYHEEHYRKHHPKGKKSNFKYRLDTPDRLGKANAHKIGLGALLGLEDWRTDSFFCALHLNYLSKIYWQSKFSISFPRIRPAEGISAYEQCITEKELTQLICAYRLLDENVELSLSTRESQVFRDNIIKLGITSISAGSATNPGGYSVEKESLEQFEIDDHRSPKEISQMLLRQGFEPVWKDWDKVFNYLISP